MPNEPEINLVTPLPPGTNPVTNPVAPKPKHFTRLRRLKGWVKAHPKKSVAIGVAILALLGVGGWAAFRFLHHRPIIPQITQPAVPPKPVTVPAPLTGLPVSPALAARPIRAVVIENFDPDARPQSGLSQAGVVYEALAEGGITRFLAFFGDGQPKVLGPVRSIRTYFVSWALEFNAPVAHAGGNADALDEIRPLHMKDMNEFYHGGSFYRTSDRFAPHNLYTGTAALDRLMKSLGYYTAPKFTVSPRKDDSPPAAGTHAAHPKIVINYSYSDYSARYVYSPKDNNYKRYLAGALHIDRNTGKPIYVKNIVVEFMPTSYGQTRIGEQTVRMKTVGSGKALVFRDGTVVVGTWTKDSNTSRTKLLDAKGQEIPLNRGNTWYSIVPPTGSVGY